MAQLSGDQAACFEELVQGPHCTVLDWSLACHLSLRVVGYCATLACESGGSLCNIARCYIMAARVAISNCGSCRSHGNLATPHGVDFAGASAAQGSVKSEPIVSDYKGELGVFPLPEPAQTRQSPSYTPRGTQRPGQNGHKGDLPSGRKHSTKKGMCLNRSALTIESLQSLITNMQG